MQDHPLSQRTSRIDDDAWIQAGVVADGHAIADDAARADGYVLAQLRTLRNHGRQIAEQEKFDIIFQEMPAYVSPRIDITDRVIKALEGKSPAK
jgi:Skp family chaperone for outer membrane proteins